MPEWIAQVEEAGLNLDVRTLLEGALAVGGAIKAAVLYCEAALSVERALSVKILIFNDHHF